VVQRGVGDAMPSFEPSKISALALLGLDRNMHVKMIKKKVGVTRCLFCNVRSQELRWKI
jgi:hypothetical protein